MRRNLLILVFLSLTGALYSCGGYRVRRGGVVVRQRKSMDALTFDASDQISLYHVTNVLALHGLFVGPQGRGPTRSFDLSPEQRELAISYLMQDDSWDEIRSRVSNSLVERLSREEPSLRGVSVEEASQWLSAMVPVSVDLLKDNSQWGGGLVNTDSIERIVLVRRRYCEEDGSFWVGCEIQVSIRRGSGWRASWTGQVYQRRGEMQLLPAIGVTSRTSR